MDNLPLQSITSKRVKIAGRDVPVWGIGAGAGIALALFLLLVKRRPGAASQAATVNASVETANQNAELASLRAGVDQSLAAQRAQFTQEITQQVSGLQTSTANRFASLQNQFSGSIASVQSDVERQRAETQATLQKQAAQETSDIQALTGKVQTLDQRVSSVESGQATYNKTIFNIATYLGRWFPQMITNLTPAQQQQAGSELTGNITTRIGAVYGRYQ